MTIDATTRMAYVDGELDEIARRRVERAVAADPALAEAVAQDRALRETVQARFAPYAEAPTPDRFTALLDSDVISIDSAPRRAKSAPPVRWWVQGMAIAATLVLGIAIGQQVGETGPVATRGGALVAQGRLASALDTELASTQAGDTPVRIGLTFRSTGGPICRTFQGVSLQGIACRSDSHWNLVRTAGGERGATYRQASSGDPDILRAAQAMMAGKPFGARAEAQARERDWD